MGHLWLLDPLEQTLEVLRLREGAWTIVGVLTGKATVRAEPFDAIALELGELWPDADRARAARLRIATRAVSKPRSR